MKKNYPYIDIEKVERIKRMYEILRLKFSEIMVIEKISEATARRYVKRAKGTYKTNPPLYAKKHKDY